MTIGGVNFMVNFMVNIIEECSQVKLEPMSCTCKADSLLEEAALSPRREEEA